MGLNGLTKGEVSKLGSHWHASLAGLARSLALTSGVVPRWLWRSRDHNSCISPLPVFGVKGNNKLELVRHRKRGGGVTTTQHNSDLNLAMLNEDKRAFTHQKSMGPSGRRSRLTVGSFLKIARFRPIFRCLCYESNHDSQGCWAEYHAMSRCLFRLQHQPYTHQMS